MNHAHARCARTGRPSARAFGLALRAGLTATLQAALPLSGGNCVHPAARRLTTPPPSRPSAYAARPQDIRAAPESALLRSESAPAARLPRCAPQGGSAFRCCSQSHPSSRRFFVDCSHHPGHSRHRCARVLTRSVLAFGCAPLRPPCASLHGLGDASF